MEVQNIKIVGSPQSRTLHLVGDVEKVIVTYLIDSIMAINEEEEGLNKLYEAQALDVMSKITLHKFVDSDSGQVGITMKREEVVPIELHINSGGGSLDDGMALINVIKTSDVPVIAIVSKAMSMATVIALSCDKIETYPNTQFMIHELAYGHEGKLVTHKEMVAEGDRCQKLIDTIILDNSEIPKEDLQAHYDSGKDWLIYGDDIRDYGMTNEIIELKKGRDTKFIGDGGDVE